MSDRTYMQAEIVRREIEALKAAYPELEDDDELLADTLEGETDFRQILSRLVGMSREAEAMAEAVDIQIKQMSERKARHKRRNDAMRALIHKLMDAAHAGKVTLPEATISIRNGTPKAMVTEETELPAEYWRVKREPDLPAIKDALKSGASIPGAVLSNAEPSLSIRRT